MVLDMVGDIVPSEVGSLMADEADDWHISIHPSVVLGVDPFDFCNAGQVGCVLDPAEWPTLTERVVRFFEGYEHPVGESA
jgi:hypothetical protein